MKEIRKKLGSSKGETIAEVLVASLIAALALLMLATMVMSATHTVTKSEKSINKVYSDMTEIEEESHQDGTLTIQVKRGNGTIISVNDVPKYVDSNGNLKGYENK